MTEVTKKIPKFKTIAEEAHFWDSHDVAAYLPYMREIKVSFNPLAPKEETLTIRVQSTLKRRVEKIAKSYGVNLSTLLRIWFIEKVKEGSGLGRLDKD